MKIIEIELAIVRFFGARKYLIIPNVSWGLGIHECDLVVLTPNGYVTEIEIKTSKYDLKKDRDKKHGHKSNLIKRLFFAIPEKLKGDLIYIPEQAGIIIVNDNRHCEVIREAKINVMARPLPQEQILHLGKLASMRIWNLKEKLYVKTT